MSVNRRVFMAGAMGVLATPALAHDNVREVAIRDFGFEPERLTVHPHDKIRFTNHDLVPHTATALDESWDTGVLETGEEVTLTVGADWTSDYYCVLHPSMTATLVLEDH